MEVQVCGEGDGVEVEGGEELDEVWGGERECPLRLRFGMR